MKINAIALITVFLYSYCIEENEIIRIPNKVGIFRNIPTKCGNITYSFHNSRIVMTTKNLLEEITPYTIYIIEGIKNLELLQLPPSTELNRFIKKTNYLEFTYEYQEKDRHHPFICEIFYKAKYINRMIYSIGNNEKGEKYTFFGGTPKNIIKNLNKFNFNNKKSNIEEIKVNFYNKASNMIDLSNINKTLEIKQDFYSMLCLPESILSQFTNLFLKDYKVYNYQYEVFRAYLIFKLTSQQKNDFPEISFKIDNMIISINKENAFNKTENNSEKENYLLINKVPCNNFVFGSNFLDLFDISEFNLESGEVNLYLDKNRQNFIKLFSCQNKIQTIIIFLSFLSISIIIILLKFCYKNSKIEYYNLYYDI